MQSSRELKSEINQQVIAQAKYKHHTFMNKHKEQKSYCQNEVGIKEKKDILSIGQAININ